MVKCLLGCELCIATWVNRDNSKARFQLPYLISVNCQSAQARLEAPDTECKKPARASVPSRPPPATQYCGLSRPARSPTAITSSVLPTWTAPSQPTHLFATPHRPKRFISLSSAVRLYKPYISPIVLTVDPHALQHPQCRRIPTLARSTAATAPKPALSLVQPLGARRGMMLRHTRAMVPLCRTPSRSRRVVRAPGFVREPTRTRPGPCSCTTIRYLRRPLYPSLSHAAATRALVSSRVARARLFSRAPQTTATPRLAALARPVANYSDDRLMAPFLSVAMHSSRQRRANLWPASSPSR